MRSNPGVFELGDGRDRDRRLRLQRDPGHAVRLDRGQHLQARRRGQRRPRLQLRDLDHGAVGSELPAVVRAHKPAVGDGALGELSPAMRASIQSRTQLSVWRAPQDDLRAQQRPGRGCRADLPGESHGVPAPPQPRGSADQQHTATCLRHLAHKAGARSGTYGLTPRYVANIRTFVRSLGRLCGHSGRLSPCPPLPNNTGPRLLWHFIQKPRRPPRSESPSAGSQPSSTDGASASRSPNAPSPTVSLK